MKKLALFFVLFLSITANAQTVLAEGEWYKIAVTETGVYRIDDAFLKKSGVSLQQVSARQLRLFGNGGAMLPQPNAAPRPTDLAEIGVWIKNNDAPLTNDNYLLFFGESPHKRLLSADSTLFSHQKNVYSDTTYYFLQVSKNEGKRIKTAELLTQKPDTTFTAFDDYFFYENDANNLLKSGRSWFGEFINQKTAFDLKIEGIESGFPLILTSSLVGVTRSDQNINLLINNNLIGVQGLERVFYDATDRYNKYERRGNIHQQRFTVKNLVPQQLTYAFETAQTTPSGAYLDFFGVQSKRALKFYDQATLVETLESRNYEVSQFVVENYASDKQIWDVTHPSEVALIQAKNSENKAIFENFTKNQRKKYFLFSEKNILFPKTIQRISTQNIRSYPTPNLLIVCSGELRTEAQRLADFRQKNDNLKVAVVTTQEIYNEFSSGSLDPTAIRDAARWFWLKDKQAFRYLLLFGDASYDYKNTLNFQGFSFQNYVPTYESRESLEPVYSFSSDDYFGFMDENEGAWNEGESKNNQWSEAKAEAHTLDIGVGRLPVENATQAKEVVDKLIFYATSKTQTSDWKNKISFVADNEDGNIHHKDVENLSEIALQKNPALRINKVLLGAFPLVGTANGNRSPEANKRLTEAVEKGSLVINYNGHGSENGWTDEKLLTTEAILKWRNLENLPVFLTATCEFGRYDNPAVVSGAELTLRNPAGGGCALLTTSRPVYSSSNFSLNQAFYEALETTTNEIRLGDLMIKTKNASIIGVKNRNFTLLGDPSMALALPRNTISLVAINDSLPQKQVLRALQRIKLKGKIAAENFNGTVEIKLYDKIDTLATLATATTSSMKYTAFQQPIYQGVTTVKNSYFETEIRIPKDIDYRLGQGKMYFSAINSDSTENYIGSFEDFKIGGSENVQEEDTTPPEVELSVDENNVLTAHIFDENGITISQKGIGHEINISLNDTLKIKGNPYYLALEGYQKGILRYSFGTLPEGNYTIQLKIWDTYNNSTTKALQFEVKKRNFELVVENVYPNPANEVIYFELQHNAANEDIDVTIHWFNAKGQKIDEQTTTCYYCTENFKVTIDNSKQKFINGNYYYRIEAQQNQRKNANNTLGKVVFWK